jgi:hypothetical protein
MIRKIGTLALGLALLSGSFQAMAQRVRLDDSLSPVDTLHVDLAWEADALARTASAPSTLAVELPPATGRIAGAEIRLDTSAWVGQQARIFLTIPDMGGESMDIELRWEAGGRFLPGSVRPGQSTLVFEGPIDGPVTSVVFSFVLLVGDRAGSLQNGLDVFYELEALP